MDKFLIKGGKKLGGAARITSAKNAFLPILAGCILCDKPITLRECPEYVDIVNMTKILENLGAKVETSCPDGKIHNNCDLTIDCGNLSSSAIPQELASCLRSSIFSLGSILGKQKKAKVAYPGGCAIGARPIDLHIKGLKALNVKITDKHGYLTCDGSNMRGGIVNLDFPSVGATENSMLLLNESLATTNVSEGLFIAKDVVRAMRYLGVRSVFNTHMHDLAKNLDEMNTKTEGKSIVQSLVTGVDNGERSFKVYISPPQGSSYARDIAKKYGVTFEQIKLNIDKT